MYMHTLTYIMQPDQSILSVISVKVAQGEFSHQVPMPWVSAQQTVRMQIVIAVAIAGEHMAGKMLWEEDMLLLKSFGILDLVNSFCNLFWCSALKGLEHRALIVCRLP